METMQESLRDRYDLVFQSATDSFFYQNLHHYFDLVEKTPKLKRLLDESQKEYADRHSEIWSIKSEANDELTNRLERFNLYALSATIYVRVYLPIEDYKHSKEPEDKQDPVALLMIKGIDGISTKKWDRKRLKLYNRWFDGMRPMYESKLRQFHSSLLAAMEKVPNEKAKYSFSKRTGDFVFKNKKGTLTPKSQEHKVFSVLINDKDFQAPYLALIKAMHPTANGDTKTERADLYKVVDRLEKKMGTGIFKNIKKVGYRLVLPPEVVIIPD